MSPLASRSPSCTRRAAARQEQCKCSMAAGPSSSNVMAGTQGGSTRLSGGCGVMSTRAAVLLVALCGVVGVVRGQGVCSYDSRMGATFDLQDLVRYGDMPAYSVTDGDIPCTPEVEQNFTYVFNICNQVSGEVPRGCERYAGQASALQMDRRPNADPANSCHRAGSFDATSAQEAEAYFSLLDPTDPSKGVSLVYTGEHCTHNDAGQTDNSVTRRFELRFECFDSAVAVPIHALEFHHCQYTVTIPSTFGCPLECPVVNKHLCNGHGHCAYDTDLRQARCFCDMGFTGPGCGVTAMEASTLQHHNRAVTGVLGALFVLVIGLLGATLIMFKQVKAYKEDATNYISLAGGDLDDQAGV